MADHGPVTVEHGEIIPPWMKWAGGIAATTIIGLTATLIWGLVGGGIDRYVEDKAKAVVTASEQTDDGGTQSAKISELTNALGNLTTAIETSEQRDAEFRMEVRDRLQGLTNAVLELAQ